MTDNEHACPATVADVVRDAFKEVKPHTDRTARIACEFGFKARERGWNLEMTLQEFDKIMGPAS